MPELAYVNGEILPLNRAMVHVEDRGFQFADSVYEVLRTYDGRLFAVDEHLARLEQSMAAIELTPPLSRAELARILKELVRRSEFREAVVYLQITRGVAPRHRAIPPNARPSVVATVRELAPAPERLSGPGIKIITVTDFRWARCDIKTTALLANVLAFHQARKAGADDAVFVAADGTIEESTAGNVFVVRGGQLLTPPTGARLLAGITRRKIIEAAGVAGVPCREGVLTREELWRADEVFLSSTTAQITPVGWVDGQPVGNGQCGLVTARIYEAFLRLARAASE
ncbi:MAG: D-amino acid aminotransferase [Verrucomicrobiae bacterium]|nr:D-amino acid aminotransferase [Verrucomicrobiae bacterium]